MHPEAVPHSSKGGPLYGDHQAVMLISKSYVSKVLVGGIIRLKSISYGTVPRVMSLDVVSTPCAIVGTPSPVDQRPLIAQ